MTGQTIKDYTISNVLGKGGMATVYLAMDKKFQTHVAVKVLNKEFIHNENIRRRFLAEARNMFRMSHPNVIKVTDLIDDGDLVAFVMEYIEGQTLKDYIEKRGRLSEQEIRPIFGQILDAVGYVHEMGLVHRDIKPSNFIITEKGQVKLLDFGIAKNWENQQTDLTLTGTAQIIGTPMYMSPEQIIQTKDVNAVSDIYSLGVVLWQMVTGKKPYNAGTLSSFELQTKIVNDSLDDTLTGWDTIIKKATSKDWRKRYQDCKSVKKELLEKPFIVAGQSSTVFDAEKTIVDNLNVNSEGEGPVPAGKYPQSINTVHDHAGNKRVINQKLLAPILFVSAIVIAVIVFFIIKGSGPKVEKPDQNQISGESKSKEKNNAITEEVPADNKEKKNLPVNQTDNSGYSSYLDDYGKLIFQSDCYIIVAGAWKYEKDARNEVVRLRKNSFSNAGYLWIPDFPSLSGKQNYATFLGPYNTYEECMNDLKLLPRGQRFYYAKKVSMKPMNQQEIRF